MKRLLSLISSAVILAAWTHGAGFVGATPVVNAASFVASSPALNGLLVGTVTAANYPTSWAISSCSGCSGYFAIDSVGNLTTTTTGAANIVPTSNYSPIVTATNLAGTSGPAMIPVRFYADGFTGAGTNTSSLPTILNSYVARPAWKIAGVDYTVGYPSGQSFSDPSTATLPTGCVYTGGSSANVTCAAGSGTSTTLTGLDFSLHNGIELILQSSAGLANYTVSNSHFKIGSNSTTCATGAPICGTTIYAKASVGNLTLLNSEIDCSSLAVTSQQGTCLDLHNHGAQNFRYNYFHHAGGDMIDTTSGPQSQNYLYNLFYQIGINTGHSDTVQWFSAIGTGTSSISFNTVVQTVNQPGAGNGILTPIAEGSSDVLTNMTLTNNVLIATAACTTCNFMTGYYQDLGGVGDHLSIRNTWIDPTGPENYTGMWLVPTGYFATPFASPTTISNTTDLVTGVTYSAYPTSSPYFVVPDSVGYSPRMDDIYSFAASPSSGTVTTGNTITITLTMDDSYTITAGTPTLSLDSGGSATYSSGSGTSALVFSYTVGSSDISSNLQITAINLNGAIVRDSYGNDLTLKSPYATFSGLQINGAGAVPVVVAASPIASSTNANLAQTGQAIATLTASNSPTSWTITGCSPSCSSYFSINSSGNLTVSSTGAASITTTDNGNVYTPTVTATNGSGTSAGVAIPVTFYSDGALTSPGGTPQKPTLLSGYFVRAPWKVAGVDYAVGITPGTTLKDPTGGGLPTGCTVGGSTVTCSTAGATLDGWDFSLHNGMGLAVNAANITVSNSKFGSGSNKPIPIRVNSGGSNLRVAYNTMDEGGILDAITAGGMIFFASGTPTGILIEYNYLANAAADFLDLESGAATIRYNLFINDGLSAGSHPDFCQFNPGGTNSAPQMYFNTWMNTTPVTIAGQGTVFGDNGTTLAGASRFNDNTLIASGSSTNVVSAWVRVYLPDLLTGATVSLQNNYADITQAVFFAYPGSSNTQTTWANNRNMVSGAFFSNSP